jgi:hypothetical protein
MDSTIEGRNSPSYNHILESRYNNSRSPSSSNAPRDIGSINVPDPDKGKKTTLRLQGPPTDQRKNATTNHGSTNSFLSKEKENPKYEVKTEKIKSHIQHMQEHAFIGKFMGIWPTTKYIAWWVKKTWKPKGQIYLKIVSKGLFTIVFSNMEDRDRVFENDPYLFNSAGLHFWP